MVKRRIAGSMARIPRAAAVVASAALLLAMASDTATVEAFTSSPSSLLQTRPCSSSSTNRRIPSIMQPRRPASTPSQSQSSSTSLNFLGNDGGILGVGAPEVAVTLLVGYFVLGPSDLYKLVKEVGKFIQNFRTLGSEAVKQFEGTMEDNLELTEIRKAQAELNEAFNFRRSINTFEEGDAFNGSSFSENIAAAEASGAAAAAAGAAGATAVASDGSTVAVEEGTAPKKKRRLVRRKKKKAVEEEEINVPSESDVYPDLDMMDADLPPTPVETTSGSEVLSEEEKLRAERLERLSGGDKSSTTGEPDWFTASEDEIASEVLNNQPPVDPAMAAYEKQRFQSQMSPEQWNSQIMDNEDELSPLSMVMQRLAILEDEKNAADKRLEEEYEKRMDNEDKFYLEKRRVLEEAITDIQESVYGNPGEKKKEEVGESNAPKFT